MKSLMLSLFLISASAFAQVASSKPTQPAQKVPVPPAVDSRRSVNVSELANRGPKAIFLLKRARIDSAIGEPVIYPFERQTRNLYFDLPAGVLTND